MLAVLLFQLVSNLDYQLLTKLLLRDAHKKVDDSSRIRRFLVGSSSVPVSRYDSSMQDTGVPVPRINRMHARKRTTKKQNIIETCIELGAIIIGTTVPVNVLWSIPLFRSADPRIPDLQWEPKV